MCGYIWKPRQDLIEERIADSDAFPFDRKNVGPDAETPTRAPKFGSGFQDDGLIEGDKGP